MNQLEPQDADAWFKQGKKQYWQGNYEAALASFKRVLDLVPKKYTAWNFLGLTLNQLKRYHEALASFNKSLEIKADYPQTWNYLGLLLNELERYQEAINSYKKALTIKPRYYQARNNLGNALKNSRCYKEAIASYERALELTKNQYWRAWKNRGWAFFELSRYQEALKNWDDGLQQLKSRTRDYQEGCGELHNAKGRAQYLHGQHQENPFLDWRDAAKSYQAALKFLTFKKFPLRHLEVLQALIKVCRGLGEKDEAQELEREGCDLLKRLLQETPSDAQKIRLSRKFAAFNQYRVDSLAQFGNWCAALELAEQRKNLCLRWLRYNHWVDPTNVKICLAVPQLDSQTAAIYWHISPAAITTFILKHKQPPLARILTADTTSAGADRQLQKFEEWVKKWNDFRGRQRL
jgi:lipoprotein NlpI